MAALHRLRLRRLAALQQLSRPLPAIVAVFTDSVFIGVLLYIATFGGLCVC
jgi:hypothetical protein